MLTNIRKYSLFVLMSFLMLTSCVNKNAKENNYPTPNVDFTLPVGQVYSVDTLLYMWTMEGSHRFNDDASLYAVVTADETSGNLYKAVFVQDGDKAIELYMNSTSGLRIGDSIRVYLKGAMLSEYSGTPQIQDLDPNNVIVIANGKDYAPDTISTTDITHDYICRLVTFDNVEFPDYHLNKTYAYDDSYGQFSLVQYDDNGVMLDSSVIVRTSNYASFADTPLAQGNGSITGILTYYSSNSVWQFTIRSMSEVKMNGPRFGGMPPVEPGGSGTEEDPYNIGAAIENQGDSEAKWISGYIVGSANISSGFIENDSQISWNAPFDMDSNKANVILADNADETDINKCVVVYLPSNAESGIRSINLFEHPENLGKQLNVKGELTLYLGKPGMKKSNEYSLK